MRSLSMDNSELIEMKRRMESVCASCGKTIYLDEETGTWSTSKVWFKAWCGDNSYHRPPESPINMVHDRTKREPIADMVHAVQFSDIPGSFNFSD
jgi:ribosomal protein L37AE/L43A